jgi:2-succinyl-5-enolpyruvyl-6-hydroxy-3-cyclohexene-1-carboxylate synthase
MIDHLQHISDLVEICRLKNIKHVVVSPGSRNSPLIIQFAREKAFTLHSIVDERSAGFYALGISLSTCQPVILLCTSGTAVLNYSPALAEAYYQHVPLIAITADRPSELIDQQDNQTIRQQNVYHNFIKESLHLDIPLKSLDEVRKMHLAVSNVISCASSGIKGPVHINVPIAEPLNVEIPVHSAIFLEETKVGMSNLLSEEIQFQWQRAERRLILCGQDQPNEKLNEIVNKLASEKNTVVLAEPISNCKGEAIISSIDRIMMLVEEKDIEEFQPDILVSLGGPVVSKRLKQRLQKQPDLLHFRLAEEDDHIDTYHNLSCTVIGKPADLLEQLFQLEIVSDSEYRKKWAAIAGESLIRQNDFLNNAPYSDLFVFSTIMKNLPDDCILHFGNSSPIRYGQLFDSSKSSAVFSNRGVSGIDGCLSTAAGYASQSDKINLVILGDLSFLYDSNGLWNRNLSENMRIIVINNQGGGIFRLITTPTEKEGFREFIEAYHPVNIEKIAAAYGVSYSRCEEKEELEIKLEHFFSIKKGASLLEIITPRVENPVVYSNLSKHLKN